MLWMRSFLDTFDRNVLQKAFSELKVFPEPAPFMRIHKPNFSAIEVTDFRSNEELRSHEASFHPFDSIFRAADSTLVFRDFLNLSNERPTFLSKAPRI